jgi:transposase
MEQYIGCDSHRRYSVFVVMNERGQESAPMRVKHDRGEIREFLRELPVGSQVAIESTGGWYWLVDEMEAAGLRPQLANAHEAKQRMAGRNKTDKFDARGLAMELLMGTLPSVWIPPAELRDLRALMRTRLALRAQSTQVKNRVSAAVNRYGLKEPQRDGDLFEGSGRVHLNRYVQCFPSAARLASYAGLVPTVHSSGGKTWHGRVPKNANLYLKWAFVEAANCIVAQRRRLKGTHVVELYERLRAAKGHGKAAVAVARHLAEASWWVLTKRQPYREPNQARMSSSLHG